MFKCLILKSLKRLRQSVDEVLGRLTRLETTMAATLDQVLSDVTAQTTKLDSIVSLITGLKQQLADALAGTTLPPAVQAKVDAIFATAEANSAKIDTALSANVPPTP